jgi:hypothetical protein
MAEDRRLLVRHGEVARRQFGEGQHGPGRRQAEANRKGQTELFPAQMVELDLEGEAPERGAVEPLEQVDRAAAPRELRKISGLRPRTVVADTRRFRRLALSASRRRNAPWRRAPQGTRMYGSFASSSLRFESARQERPKVSNFNR